MEDSNSVIVQNVTKTFRIYHEKRNSIYEYVASILDRQKAVDELSVLRDVSFSVKKGEMLGIIGFNGSGKTTLLKIIGRIYHPDKGSVITNGKVTPFLELGTGFNGELTAKDNIIIYGVILGFTKKEIKEKIESIAKFAEVERFLDTKLKNFSSGMNARLAFATAIQVNPDILLVDEVLSVGDISFQEKSFNTFMDFKKRGKTIIFVSHALDQMRDICDKILWVHDGIIKSYGNPSTVIDEYKQFASTRDKL
ncbi:MAG: ABC transporter ATP-binding protein [Thaumarchaeota archaeon]|nr:ABC transporter ATP-binding protein [Nitrososphaerota archaeon]